jgi:hypothetical protein
MDAQQLPPFEHFVWARQHYGREALHRAEGAGNIPDHQQQCMASCADLNAEKLMKARANEQILRAAGSMAESARLYGHGVRGSAAERMAHGGQYGRP